MSFEEIKAFFCTNEKAKEKLNKLYQQINIELQKQVELVKNLEEYKIYQTDTENEEARIKLINMEEYKKFIELKNKIDNLQENITLENNKCSEEEFEKINKEVQCEHLMYQQEDGVKCIKCGYKKEERRENRCIKDLMISYLYIELTYYYKKNDKEYQKVSKIIQEEPIEYIIMLTKKILQIHPNITNEELGKILESEISEINIGILNSIYSDENKIDTEIVGLYEMYKNKKSKK